MAYESNGKLITGNLIHDSKAKEYTLDANVGNVELMRLMVIANEIMPNFSEYSLNSLKVISNNHKYSAYQSMDMLKKNFDQLVYLAN
jgi:hypothetical protein